jgi:hypothetical protein
LNFCFHALRRRGDGSLSGSLVILGNNSRFGEFYSRFGGYKFPVRAATGIFRQGVDFSRYF